MYIKNENILKVENCCLLSLSEVKTFLRISYSEDDNLILSIIKSAIQYAENFMNIFLSCKSIFLDIKNTNKYQIILRYIPILKIEKILSPSLNNKELIINEDYIIDRYKLKFMRYYSDLQIYYFSGYEKLPELIKHSLLTYIASIYEYGSVEKYNLRQIHNSYLQFKRFNV